MATPRSRRQLQFGSRQTRAETYDAEHDSLQVQETLSELTQPSQSVSSDSSQANSTTLVKRQLSKHSASTSPEKKARQAAKQRLDNVVEAFHAGIAQLLADVTISQLQNKKSFVSAVLVYVAEIYRCEHSIDQLINVDYSSKKYNKNKNWLGIVIIDHYTIANANGLHAGNILLNEFRDTHLRIYEKSLRYTPRDEALNDKLIALKELTRQHPKSSFDQLTPDNQRFVKDIIDRMDEKFMELEQHQYTNENAYEFLQKHLRDHLDAIITYFDVHAADFILCLTHELGLVLAKNRLKLPATTERSNELGEILISKAAELHYPRSAQWLYNYHNPVESNLTEPLSDADTASIHSNSSADTAPIANEPQWENAQPEEDDSVALTSEEESTAYTNSDTESVDWDRTERDEIYSQPRFGSL